MAYLPIHDVKGYLSGANEVYYHGQQITAVGLGVPSINADESTKPVICLYAGVNEGDKDIRITLESDEEMENFFVAAVETYMRARLRGKHEVSEHDRLQLATRLSEAVYRPTKNAKDY